MARVFIDNHLFAVSVPFWDNERAKGIPERKWEGGPKLWMAPCSFPNALYLQREFAVSEIEPDAAIQIRTLIEKSKPVSEHFPTDFKFKTKPMSHQMDALNAAWHNHNFALFMEMGTGKTWIDIMLMCAYYMEGSIDAAAVICPTAIKPVWKMELEKHCPLTVDPLVLESGDYGAYKRWKDNGHDFKILIIGIEALSQGGAKDILSEFVQEYDTMVTVDESSRIKNPKAKRTTVCWDIAGHAAYRMAMTGTPITQGIQDLFAQFRFLSWEIIGMTSYFVFRNRYCILGGFEGKQIIGYMNVPELIGLTAPYVFQVQKKDVLDLPDKVYQTRLVEPSTAQKKAIKELGDIMETTVDDITLEVETILERMTRYQQIAGGNFPYPIIDPKTELITYKTKPMPGKNPKLEELKSVIEETGGKVVIWARFIPEMEVIETALKKAYGFHSTVTYRGGMSTEERQIVMVKFQDPNDSVRFFVVNQQTGSMGLTLTASHTVIFYSNSFSYEDRVQAEDRNHRIGTKHAVDYIDLTLNHKVDQMIIEALAKKKGMAEYVTEEIKRRKEYV
mgnify:CR=1 FL=1